MVSGCFSCRKHWYSYSNKVKPGWKLVCQTDNDLKLRSEKGPSGWRATKSMFGVAMSKLRSSITKKYVEKVYKGESKKRGRLRNTWHSKNQLKIKQISKKKSSNTYSGIYQLQVIFVISTDLNEKAFGPNFMWGNKKSMSFYAVHMQFLKTMWFVWYGIWSTLFISWWW